MSTGKLYVAWASSGTAGADAFAVATGAKARVQVVQARREQRVAQRLLPPAGVTAAVAEDVGVRAGRRRWRSAGRVRHAFGRRD